MRKKQIKKQEEYKIEMASPGDVLEEAISDERNRRNWIRFLAEIAIAVAVVILIFNVIIGVCRISGTSMAPTFDNGDKVLFLRLTKTFKPGDVVVIKTKSKTRLILRVVAVAGDMVYIDPQDKKLYINGEVVKESNIYTKTQVLDESVEYPITVEKDHVFALGDNREKSEDSRLKEIGQVSQDQIVGKVFFMVRNIK